MPLFQSPAGRAPSILTKDGDRVVAYAITPAGTKRLRETGVRHGRTVPGRVLASLIRSGEAHSPRTADAAGQQVIFGDDDTADHLPRCELTGATTDLHLVVYGEGNGVVAKLMSKEPRFILQKVTSLSATLVVRNARLHHELSSASVQRWEKLANHAKLAERDKKVAARRGELAELEAQLAKLPKVDKAKLNRILKLESDRSNAHSALQAMATGLEVVASDQPVSAGGQSIKIGQRQILMEDTELQIGAAIRLRVQPGGGTSLTDARKTEADARQNLQAVLDALGLQSVAVATEVHARRDELGGRIKAAHAELDGLGAENLAEELQVAQNELTAATANVERLAALVNEAETPADIATAKALMKALAAKLGEAEDREAEAKYLRDRSAKALDSADEKLREKRTETEQQRLKLNGLKAQLELLVKTHGDDQARSLALHDIQSDQVATQHRLKITTDAIAALQPELLEGDQTRIARAIKERTGEQGDARTQMAVAKAALSSDGSEDPASELTAAEVRARSAREQWVVVQRRSQAVALLHQLFQEEQRGLAEQFTQPLADKISAYLQCLFGAGVRAQVDREDNEFTGLRLLRPGLANAPFGFDTLSGGAREQTAAAVRLAMAELLAADYDGCLPVVFDDAFAYSDPERVNQLQRMLDLAATRGLQIIVLTCNPTDYAALGAKTVALRSERFISAARNDQIPNAE